MFALRQRRTGYNRQSAAKSIEFPLTFGLGNAQKVDELTITWPSGKATTLTDLKADQIYQVNEESGVAR
ncbi:MAG: ASPIC/UnbV domain-containing protein [Isosphaeraceae bacterium]